MLGNINNFSYTNYQNRENLTFSGKSFVQMNLLGEKYLVPRSVADVRRSVKTVFAKDKFNEKFISIINAINFENNLFLGVAHLFDGIKEVSSVTIGKIYNKGKKLVNKVEQHIEFKKFDLGMFKIEMPKDFIFAKSNPIKLADKLPQKGETVYIVGYHKEYKGPKAIPASYGRLINPRRCSISPAANCFKITSDFLKGRLNPHGLSGAAVVNKEGKLIGILTDAKFNRKNKKSNGTFYAISAI